MSRTKVKPVDNESFIKVWQNGKSVADVADSLKLAVARTSARASMLRRKGVPLKKFPGGGRKSLDIPKLAALAKKYGNNNKK